jgi:hypothetical protein
MTSHGDRAPNGEAASGAGDASFDASVDAASVPGTDAGSGCANAGVTASKIATNDQAPQIGIKG